MEYKNEAISGGYIYIVISYCICNIKINYHTVHGY